MATRIEEILGRDINSLKELREEIKRLQDSIASVDPTSKEFKDTTTKLIAAQEQLTSVTRAGKDENVAAKDSIVGMEKEYKALYNTYKMLTEEQRNSDFGQNMAESLNTLSNKLNETKKGVGNFKDNIGRYTDSIMDAFKQMGVSLGGLSAPLKLATNGVKGLNTALKANPLMVIIGAIQLFITVLGKMKSAIAGNEELQLRWNQAMSAFKPIADAMANAVDKLAGQFVTLIEKIASAVRWIREAGAAVTDFLGITKGAKKAIQEQNKLYQDLAAAQANLTKKKREYQVLSAKDEAEVQRLREEASETANLEERKKLLTEAKEIQAQIDERNIEIAKEELRILEEQSKLTANSAADNDKLAEATAKVANAEAQAAANARMFNKQLGLSKAETVSTTTALKNYRDEAKELYEETVEWNKSEVQKLTEKYQKEKALLEKYHYDTTLLTKKYNQDLTKIYEEGAKKAAEAASAAYVKAAKEKISAGGEFDSVAQELQTELDGALKEFYQMRAKKEQYQDFLTNFFSLDPAMEGFKEEGERLIAEINEILDTDIHFPPEISDQSLAEFRGKCYGAVDIFDQALERMEARVKKINVDEKLDSWMKIILHDQMTALQTSLDEFDYETEMARIHRDSLEYEKTYYKELLDIQGLSDEERLEARKNYYAVLEEMRQMDWEADNAYINKLDDLWKNGFDALDDIQSSILTVVNAYSSLIQAQLNEGKVTEEQAKKKKKTLLALEKVALAVNIAQIAASTAAGIMDVWKGYATETASNAVVAAATGPAAPATLAALNTKSLASAILKTTGLATTGVANIAAATMGTIAKVRAIKGGDEGSASVPVQASVAEIDSTPYTYTRQMQTAEEEERLNQPIWVSVQDINAVQNRVRVTEEESSF